MSNKPTDDGRDPLIVVIVDASIAAGSPLSEAEVSAVADVVITIAEAIQAFGTRGVPSGELYAILMASTGMRIDQYSSVIRLLEHIGLVRVAFNRLYWVG